MKTIRFHDHEEGGYIYFRYEPNNKEEEKEFFEELQKTIAFLSSFYDKVELTEMVLYICRIQLISFKEVEIDEDRFIDIDY